MESIKIRISKETGMVYLDKTNLGRDLENLQKQLEFVFDDEFVDGNARLEYKIGGNRYHIPTTKIGESYTIPVRNVMTKEGQIEMQLVVVQLEQDEEIPVFKSNVFYMVCNKSINAQEEAPDDYEYWLDIIQEKLTEMDNINLDVERVENGVEITITKKDGTEETQMLYDGEDGTPGQDGRDGIDGLNATINGVNALTINATDGIELSQEGANATIKVDNSIARKTDLPTKVSDLTNDSNFQTGTDVSNAIATETTNRQNADNNLQEQIDAITSASDVVDVVGTYAELQAYDTQHLKDNDIIKVLVDETKQGAISYYRWNDTTEEFSYVGSQGPFYTKSESDNKFVEKETGKGLSTNDYTTEEKNKLDGIESNAEVNNVDDVKVNGTSVVDNKIANIDLTPYATDVELDNIVSKVLASTTNAGDILTIDDAFEYRASANVDGNYKQGENPSPDNPQEIEVIEGFETETQGIPAGNIGLKFVGENLFNPESRTSAYANLTFSTINKISEILINGTASVTDSTIASGNFILKAGTYTIKVNGLNENGTDRFIIQDINNNNLVTGIYNNTPKTFTLSEEKICRLSIVFLNGTSYNNKAVTIQINVGTETPTTYYPYQETIYPIPLNGNFIGKLPNGVKDELIIDKWGNVSLLKKVGKVLLDENSNIQVFNNNLYYALLTLETNANKNTVPISNRFINGVFSVGKFYITGAVGNGMVFVNTDQTLTTKELWKSWLLTHNTEVYYELATPQTINLGKIENLSTYKGVNNIELVTNLESTFEIEYANESSGGGEETDPTVPSYVKNITQSNITSWNGKQDSLQFNTTYNPTTNKVATMSDIEDAIGTALGGSY